MRLLDSLLITYCRWCVGSDLALRPGQEIGGIRERRVQEALPQSAPRLVCTTPTRLVHSNKSVIKSAETILYLFWQATPVPATTGKYCSVLCVAVWSACQKRTQEVEIAKHWRCSLCYRLQWPIVAREPVGCHGGCPSRSRRRLQRGPTRGRQPGPLDCISSVKRQNTGIRHTENKATHMVYNTSCNRQGRPTHQDNNFVRFIEFKKNLS